MVTHFRQDLEVLLTNKYKHKQIIEDPYDLVKEFCIDEGTKVCLNRKIPSVERKKEEIRKATVTNDEL